MTYKVLTVDEMKKLFKGPEKDNELIQYILLGEFKKKPFVIGKKELQQAEIDFVRKKNEKIMKNNEGLSEEEQEELLELTKIKYLAKIQVTDKIVKNGYDFSELKEGQPVFPFFDERLDEVYLKDFQGVGKIPPKGFFWLIDTSVMNRPFGVFKTETFIAQVTRKFNDFRWENVQKLRDNPRENQFFLDSKDIYYDYEQNKYVHVVPASEKGEDGKIIESEEEKELKSRQAAYEYLVYRFSEVLETYQTYFQEKYALISAAVKTPTTTADYLNIFKHYEKLLVMAKSKIPVKLILGQMDAFEYQFLIGSIDKKGVIDEKLAQLHEIKQKVKKIVENEGGAVRFNDDNWTDKYKDFYEKTLGTSEKNKFLKEIMDFITKRPEFEKSSSSYAPDGYLVAKDENGYAYRLVPNLGTHETRNFYTIHQANEDKISGFERAVLAELNPKNITVNENGEEIVDDRPYIVTLFNEKDWDRLVNYFKLESSFGKINAKEMIITKLQENKVESNKFAAQIDELKRYLKEYYALNGTFD